MPRPTVDFAPASVSEIRPNLRSEKQKIPLCTGALRLGTFKTSRLKASEKGDTVLLRAGVEFPWANMSVCEAEIMVQRSTAIMLILARSV